MHLSTLIALIILVASPLTIQAQNFPAGWELAINGEAVGDSIKHPEWLFNRLPATAQRKKLNQHDDHQHLATNWKNLGISIHYNEFSDSLASNRINSIDISFERKHLRRRSKKNIDLAVLVEDNILTIDNLPQHLVSQGWKLLRESGPLFQGKPLYGAKYVYQAPDLRLSITMDRTNKTAEHLTIAFGSWRLAHE